MSRYCEPHRLGSAWRPEVHGVVIRTRAVCRALHDIEGVWLADAARQARIPTDVPVPLGVVMLLKEAIAREPRCLGAGASPGAIAAVETDAAIEREMLFVRARELLRASRRMTQRQNLAARLNGGDIVAHGLDIVLAGSGERP